MFLNKKNKDANKREYRQKSYKKYFASEGCESQGL